MAKFFLILSESSKLGKHVVAQSIKHYNVRRYEWNNEISKKPVKHFGKTYKNDMQQQGKGFYEQDFMIITIVNRGDLYQRSALTSIKVPCNLL